MKYIIYLLAGIYFIGGIYIINVFFTKPKLDISNIEKSIVIIIPEQKLISYKNNPKGIFKESKTSGIGAGFFINNQGTIQTVNHILEDENIKYKIIYNQKEYDSIIISRNKEKDIATIKINTKEKLNFIPLNINTKNNTKNNNIFSFGIDTKNMKIIYNTGVIINKKSKLDNMSNLLEISNNIKPGFSGGPILNSNLEVIGINYAIYKSKKYGIKY